VFKGVHCAVPNYISDDGDLMMGLYCCDVQQVSGSGRSEAEPEELDVVLEGGRCHRSELCGCRRPPCVRLAWNVEDCGINEILDGTEGDRLTRCSLVWVVLRDCPVGCLVCCLVSRDAAVTCDELSNYLGML